MSIKKYFSVILILLSSVVFAQAKLKIGDNATVIASSSVLELESTTKGLLLPRMTEAQRNAIVTPVSGLMIWCTNCGTGEPQFYNGSSWSAMNSSSIGGSGVWQVGGSAICDGSFTTVVVPITSTTGKVWMDRNLGASRAATSSTDFEGYGCLYQWGRGNDGHASINWTSATAGTPVNASTATLAQTDVPGNALFITNAVSPMDWRSDNNNTRWQGASSINNPCPSGFHVPTDAEFAAEFTAYGITNAATAYANGPGGGFKFVLAGNRGSSSANINNQGSYGLYWSSTVNGKNVSIRLINNSGNDGYGNIRAPGFSVRCLKD